MKLRELIIRLQNIQSSAVKSSKEYDVEMEDNKLIICERTPIDEIDLDRTRE